MSKHGRVLVAMSGGIDSTATAMMLHDEGYEVVGITMKTWDYANAGASKKETGCCSLDSINDARAVAVKMGFHHFIIDIRTEFGDFVIDNFVSEYMNGRTPNPCVLCNTHIKWNSLVKRADVLDCENIATGHYAIINKTSDRFYISKAVDAQKDQSYVLWGLTQECLERTIFPIGKMLKPDVRKYVKEAGYEEFSKKGESYEICFVPDNDYRAFLRFKNPEIDAQLKGGKFINLQGEVIGTHAGYPFFTIGQRKNLGTAFGKPMFVTKIIPETNTVVLGELDDLKRNGIIVGGVNLQKYARIDSLLETSTQIRYNDGGTLATIAEVEEGISVEFFAPVRGVAPGQSAVFYEGDDVVGGGIIMKSMPFEKSPATQEYYPDLLFQNFLQTDIISV